MTTDHDPRTRIVLSWLREEAHENAERVLGRALDEVDMTPQRHSWWPAWRTNRMNTYAKLIAAAAVAVLVVSIGGYQSLPGGPGSGGTSATPPPPGPSLLARGVFVTASGAVELRAIEEGSSVTGRMFVREEGAWFDVDLQCTRTTEDGLIMIGGYTTETDYGGSALSPKGTFAAIVLERGSPVRATIWSQRGGPTSGAASCLAYLDEQLTWDRSTGGNGVQLEPIEGFVELGGSGSGGTDATPSPSPVLLARGNFVTAGGGVELEATGEGSRVTGRMTVSEAGYAFTVDLQCTRTTEDGLIMIGGYTTETTGGGSGLSPEGTLAAIVLERGSPVRATIWSQRGGPTSGAASCLAYLDEQLMWDRSTGGDGVYLSPIEGTVEFGP